MTSRRAGMLAALALSSVALAGCGGASFTGSVSASRGAAATTPKTAATAPWATEPVDTVAAGTPPAFPERLAHWTLSGQWSDLPRAFVESDQGWTTTVGPNAQPFPATMNGCDDGRFLVRWRAVDEGVDVLAGEARLDGQGAVEGQVWKQAAGHSGWMDIDGCYAPVFRMASALSDGTNLADVTVEVQEYLPAP
jgi:hypothetical protein